ncbi:MAG TPA: thiaminase II, partial [Longimicrobiales bacterium]|nr:thiaminase II [Longimicrobiales bacterium]
MTLSAELHAAALPIWEAQLEHPFVKGIADGSLEEERFRRWVLQDYRYLEEFARIFAWAVAKADRLESMGWYAAVLDLTLNTEMDLHRGYAARFGLTPEDLEAEPMWPTTRAYTDFLVRTSADGDLLDLLAALLPCAWGYL